VLFTEIRYLGMKFAGSHGKCASASGRTKCSAYTSIFPIRLPIASNLRSPFAMVLACSLVGCTASPGSQSPQISTSPSVGIIKVSGSGSALPVVQKLAEAYTQKHPDTQLQFEPGTNSGGAIQGVVKGNLDLAAVNRPLSKSEAKEALAYFPFARDPFVFVVHKPVPVKNLSAEQVRDIYSGKLTNWQQLGGASAPILVLDRDPDESARKLGLIPFMQGREVKAKTIILAKAKEMVQALESTPNSLGYSSRGLLKTMQAQEIEILRLDGNSNVSSQSAAVRIPQGIATNSYPWHLTLGLVHRRQPSSSLQGFVNFALSPEGRQILEKYGYEGLEDKASP
jgi:phosphate transport system substrate-binding protein